ncbi:MAG: hypothetical protein AAB721_01470 [Patescibacteria group bacterium]
MNEPQIEEQITEKKNSSPFPISILIAALIVAFAWIYTKGFATTQFQKSAIITQNAGERGEENTAQAIELPVTWGNLGVQMVATGVIDRTQLEAFYAQRGGFADDEKQLLEGDSGKIMVTQENSGLILNLLWALGLGNKNKILEEGPMSDPRYGDPGRFASTGGWTIAKGGAMDHYSKHSFITLTPEQQALVEKVSKNIYRPCCNNSTYFPDCNHGMAMLGLLELLASQGVSENQMYETALQINTLWFPEQYATIARYFESKGQTLSAISPKEILGINYSSASGFSRIAALVPQVKQQGGGSCGI